VRAAHYEDAIAVYRTLLKQEDALPATWYSLGSAYYQSGQYDKSAAAFVESAVDEKRRSRSYYNAACSTARDENIEHAFEYLENAVEAGFSDQGLLTTDEDLAALRQDARFTAVKAQMAAKQEQVSR